MLPPRLLWQLKKGEVPKSRTCCHCEGGIVRVKMERVQLSFPQEEAGRRSRKKSRSDLRLAMGATSKGTLCPSREARPAMAMTAIAASVSLPPPS